MEQSTKMWTEFVGFKHHDDQLEVEAEAPKNVPKKLGECGSV